MANEDWLPCLKGDSDRINALFCSNVPAFFSFNVFCALRVCGVLDCPNGLLSPNVNVPYFANYRFIAATEFNFGGLLTFGFFSLRSWALLLLLLLLMLLVVDRYIVSPYFVLTLFRPRSSSNYFLSSASFWALSTCLKSALSS